MESAFSLFLPEKKASVPNPLASGTISPEENQLEATVLLKSSWKHNKTDNLILFQNEF